MEVHEIKYFLVLGETLNFTRAAERCNVSQPALTRAIRNLEEKLGGELVHRERSNTHLTELGQMMWPYLSEMLEDLELARQTARDYAGLRQRRLTVGLMCTIGPSCLVDLFGAFHQNHEDIELYLKDARASELEEALQRGELDVAIYCRPDLEDERLHLLPLYTERFMIAVSPSHRLAGLRQVRLADLVGESYLSRANCEYADYIAAIAAEQNVQLHQPYTSERDDWIQAMVLAGIGFTMIPEFAVTLPGLVTRPLVQPSVTRTIKLVTVRGRPHAPAVGAFVHEAKRYNWTERLNASQQLTAAAALNDQNSIHG